MMLLQLHLLLKLRSVQSPNCHHHHPIAWPSYTLSSRKANPLSTLQENVAFLTPKVKAYDTGEINLVGSSTTMYNM
jgi:hypothetical protein